MKLLIITQKVDTDDPILGFFHHLIEEFAKRTDFVTVICLEKGKYKLPINVKLLSLGKEVNKSQLNYLLRFYRYIWQERNNYETIFVHMNQEYVLLGGLFWRLWSKKILLWRNHAKGGFLADVAVFLSNTVFCTSGNSYTAKFQKTKIMPVGIDTKLFFPNPLVKCRPRSILALGRISSVKRLDLLINALFELQKSGEQFTATIVGSPISGADSLYEKKMHRLADPLVRAGVLVFREGVPHTATPAIYQSHEIYVNLTPAGSFDKTIVEAAACGTIVLSANKDVMSSFHPNNRDILFFESTEPPTFSHKIRGILNMVESKKEKIRAGLVSAAGSHSLDKLINLIVATIKYS